MYHAAELDYNNRRLVTANFKKFKIKKNEQKLIQFD